MPPCYLVDKCITLSLKETNSWKNLPPRNPINRFQQCWWHLNHVCDVCWPFAVHDLIFVTRALCILYLSFFVGQGFTLLFKNFQNWHFYHQTSQFCMSTCCTTWILYLPLVCFYHQYRIVNLKIFIYTFFIFIQSLITSLKKSWNFFRK